MASYDRANMFEKCKPKTVMNRDVKKKFDTYPDLVRKKLEVIRSLIFEVVEEYGLGSIDESLKWGEPSYLVKGGSAVRFDWKAKAPNRFAIYFNCNTKLIATFKEIYGDHFIFEGNRAIVFDLDEPIHANQLKRCIRLSLMYHKIKNLPLLGA